jgi:hypothetical protein
LKEVVAKRHTDRMSPEVRTVPATPLLFRHNIPEVKPLVEELPCRFFHSHALERYVIVCRGRVRLRGLSIAAFGLRAELHALGYHQHRAPLLAVMLPAALLQAAGNPNHVSLLDHLAAELSDLLESVNVKE